MRRRGLMPSRWWSLFLSGFLSFCFPLSGFVWSSGLGRWSGWARIWLGFGWDLAGVGPFAYFDGGSIVQAWMQARDLDGLVCAGGVEEDEVAEGGVGRFLMVDDPISFEGEVGCGVSEGSWVECDSHG